MEDEVKMNLSSKKLAIIIVIPIILAIAGIVVLVNQTGNEIDNYVTGIVETTTVDVASKIPGRIDSLLVKEGAFVKKGEILARLESKEIDAKTGQAEAAVQAAFYKFRMAQNGARTEEKEAVLKQYNQAKHQFELAEKTWKRISSLFEDKLLSTQEKDQYEFQYKAAKEQMEAAKAKYDMVISGARFEELKMAESLYEQAKNTLLEVEVYKGECFIKSPVGGQVYKRIVEQGEIIASGYPVFSIIQPEDSWVTIQLREDKMNSIKNGDTFEAAIPALKKNATVQVTYIAPIGDFANWKPTRQKGEFDLKTFEIRLKPVNPIPELRPGMTVNINLSLAD
jgi:HlyD family secretion protein